MINQFLIIVESVICNISKSKKAKKVFGVVTFFQLFLILGLRAHTVGTDTENYLFLFGLLSNGVKFSGFEPLNLIVMKAISFLPNSQLVLLCTYAFFTIFLFYKYIYMESDDPCLSVAVFSGMMYYFFCFNAMRQGLAMAISAVAIANLLKGKSGKFLMLVLIASGFHASALVVFPLWFVKKMWSRYTFKKCIFFIFTSALMSVFGRSVLKVLLVFFPSYQRYLSGAFSDNGNYLNPLMYMVLLIFLTIIWSGYKKKDKDHFYFVVLGIGTVFYFMSIQVEIVSRIVYYFTMTVIVLLPNMLKRIPQIRNRLTLYVCAHTAIFIYCCLLIAREAHGVVPYSFFWQG